MQTPPWAHADNKIGGHFVFTVGSGENEGTPAWPHAKTLTRPPTTTTTTT
jgi:hypothetical protein